MTAPTASGEALRGEFEAGATAEIERVGPERLDKAALVKAWGGRGASRATLYRWLEALMKSGAPGRAIVDQIRTAAAARKEVAADASFSAAKEAALAIESIPAPRVADITGFGVVAFAEKLQEIISNCDFLLKYARGDEEDKPRNAKLFMMANEGLRRSLETALKLQEELREASAVDRMIAAIMEELRKESPELAERVVRRLRMLATEWGV